MSIFKLGETIRIIAGPRKGEIAIVDLVVSNGVFVKTKDGWRHAVKDIHIEKVEVNTNKHIKK
mgnify:CR=1 FL=1